MPKISAATVREHRELTDEALVDAAEVILRAGGELTAGAVAKRAGIARNSIYRYVGSVEALRGRVLARHLPVWMAAVEDALSGIDDPGERIVAWTRANLEQSSEAGHGWLMAVASGGASPPARSPGVEAGGVSDSIDHAHAQLDDALHEAWSRLLDDDAEARVQTELVRGLVDAGFRLLDAQPASAHATTIASVERAVAGLINVAVAP